MKSYVRYLIILSVIAIFGFFSLKQKEEKTVETIYISQVIEHPALNATVQGIKDVLKEKGIKTEVESAQSNPALAGQIASKFMAQMPAIVVGVGTISAQSFVKYALKNKVKLVFSSVTDSKCGLPENPNICGVSNFVDLEPQLELFKTLQPTLKRLGVLYNPGEANSVSIVTKLRTICSQYGLKIVEQTINKTADAAQSTVRLAANCDAIFISNDNTALGAIKTIIKFSKVPVYVSDTDAVDAGSIAALGPNQYTIGRQTGQMILRTLKGEKCGTEFPEKTETVINQEACKKWGLS